MTKLTTAQHWMINVGAILADDNGMPHDELYAFEPYDHKKNESTTRMLSREWGVSNEKSLISLIDRLIDGGGHNQGFCKARDYWTRFSYKQIQQDISRYSEDEQSDIRLVFDHAQSIGESGILSWDLGRIVPLIRNGYALSWISEKQAWNRLQKIAMKHQQGYKSWEQAGTAYIVGRLFWAKGGLSESTCNDYFERLRKIIINPQHPWNSLDWNTPLG